MAEIKIKDIESLNALVDALYKNGYTYSTFVIWDGDIGGTVSHYVVSIDGV